MKIKMGIHKGECKKSRKRPKNKNNIIVIVKGGKEVEINKQIVE